MSQKFTDLFFDLDNTILDFNYASHKSFHELLENNNYHHPNAYDIYKKINAGVWQRFEKGEIKAIELRAMRFDLYLKKMKWKGNGLEWNTDYLNNLIKHIKFVDGAENLMQRLKGKYKIHIVTNGLREVQRPRIKAANLGPYIDSITVSDEIGSAKPQEEFFNISFENARIKNKKSVLMIGDSYSSDIKGAFNYGLESCWLNPELKTVKNKIHTYEINSLKQLESILL